MDPLTQGVVGAAFAQLGAKNKQLGAALAVGALSGMAADLDIFIRSNDDPLLALEYHRHFTHSLIFIPIGALFCSSFFFLIARLWKPISFIWLYWWSLLGYGTHALLDVCTSYGTQIFWPFSHFRASLDIVSVIDPLFTLPCMALVIMACLKNTRWLTGAAILWAAIYLGIGAFQHERALEQIRVLAEQRGHKPERLTAKPSFANVMVWKGVYEFQQKYYVDALRLGFAGVKVWPGESIDTLNLEHAFPWLESNTQQFRDVQRFSWFSDGYLAVDSENPNLIVDMRYSLVPNQIKALWGIELDRSLSDSTHVKYITEHKDSRAASSILWSMIVGNYSSSD